MELDMGELQGISATLNLVDTREPNAIRSSLNAITSTLNLVDTREPNAIRSSLSGITSTLALIEPGIPIQLLFRSNRLISRGKETYRSRKARYLLTEPAPDYNKWLLARPRDD